MRIIVVGQGPFGEKVVETLVQKGEEVVGVFSPPDKRGESMARLAEKTGIEIFRPGAMKDPQVYEQSVKLKPTLAILAFVTDIIPEKIVNVPSLGTICYHPSLLPRHRGASAINWAIIQGNTRTGLTIFWVDKEIDTGPILLQKEVEVGPDETTGSLYFNHLFGMGVEAIVESIDLIKKKEAPRISQDESKATYEPPCDDRVASIDFEKPAEMVYNLIRGCDPQPGAFTFIKGSKVRFFEARLDKETTSKVPGEILSIEDKGLQVGLRGGCIRIGKLRVNKGEKSGPIEFAKSVGLKVGDRLGKG